MLDHYIHTYYDLPHFIKIGQTVAEIWQLNGFQNGGRPPSWICEIQNCPKTVTCSRDEEMDRQIDRQTDMLIEKSTQNVFFSCMRDCADP